MATARKRRKADDVARDLMASIASGALAVGSLLPKEAELAAHHGVNRGVVREAVKLLEAHRLVRPVRRLGTIVLEPLHSMSPDVLVALIVPRPGHADRKALASFLEVRASLDAEMTQLAAERRTQADLKAMRQVLVELHDSMQDRARYADGILRFSYAIARATKNPLYEMLAAFNGRVVSELEAMSVATRPVSPEHVEALGILVSAFEQKDGAAARKMVAAFHEWTSPRILASAALASERPRTSP